MLRNYEFTVIFRSDLGDENLATALSDYEGIIANNDGGAILKKDEWGTKRFSYPIKKHFRGYYVCYVISTTPKVIKDIEQHIRYDSKVLRYILVAIKGDVPVPDVSLAIEPSPAVEPSSAVESSVKDSPAQTPVQTETDKQSPDSVAPPAEPPPAEQANQAEQTEQTEQTEQQEQDK